MVGFKATDVPPTATVKFLGAGTAACIADLITFPLDTAKVRLQVRISLGALMESNLFPPQGHRVLKGRWGEVIGSTEVARDR
jgi:hypothetical protein